MTSAVWAYDFKVQVRNYALYFTVIDEDGKSVEVTAPLDEGNNMWSGFETPSGVLDIPAEVDNDGITYTVTAVADRAFMGCANITGIILPPTVAEIGAYAFSHCTGVTGVVAIGDEVVSIGRSAFYGCSNITTLNFNAVNCEFMGGSRSNTVFGNCRLLTRIVFGPKVRQIPDFAFAGMNMLKFEWNLPQSLEYVGEYAFAYCTSITGTLTLPNGLKSIGQYAFAQCHATKGVVIPARIESIGQRAFHQCVNVASVTTYAIVPPAIETDAFAEIKAGAVLNVPCVSVDRYRQAEGWGRIPTVNALKPCKLDVAARVENPESGIIMGAGNYRIGDTATLVAVCHAGYGFVGWSDGCTDNPRRVVVMDTTSYVAIIRQTEVVHEVEYVHDTTYMDGIEVVYETYEANDVAEPIASQEAVRYNREKRSLEVGIDRKDIVSLSLYNDAGQCVYTGRPLWGHIRMRRYPTGYYIIRVTTIDEEKYLRFFHMKNK